MAVDPMGHTRKFTRACQHLVAIEEIIKNWNSATTDETISEPDPDRTGIVDCQRYVAKIEGPLLPEFSALLGDCLHNFRGVLDHLIWYASVLHSGETPPNPRRIHFPAYESRDAYAAQGLHAVSSEVGAIVESFQPFNDGEQSRSHPLWVLCELNNFDKHRELHAVDHVALAPEIELLSALPGPWYEVAEDGPIADGTVIARVFTPVTMRGNDVTLNLRFHHGVAILATETTPLLHFGQTLILIRNTVAEVARSIMRGPLLVVQCD